MSRAGLSRISSGFGSADAKREKWRPQSLVDAGGQRVEPAQHEVDIDPPGVLLRLQLGGQLGRGCLREADARHKFRPRLAEVLDRLLYERECAADIDDVQRDR